MPGWHAATEELQRSGTLQVIGVVQEQHPDRARLFAQWKGLDFPILVDPLNLLTVSLVPITVLVDERGIVHEVVSSRADPREVVERFLAAAEAGSAGDADGPQAVDAAGTVPATAAPPDLDDLERAAAASPGDSAALRRLADALVLWGGQARLDRAIETYRAVLEGAPEDADAAFRLGVALRGRFDSGSRRPGDFAAAVEAWGRALRLDPNNYVWRRRIQQYGPRLDKPYPFYDWVAEARREIAGRGEHPVALEIEPRGAELATPAETFAAAPQAREPDPEGTIHRDEGALIHVETAVVPARVAPGGSARVHLGLRPAADSQAHWNNEAGHLVVWLDPPAGVAVDRRQLTFEVPRRPASYEARWLEFEVGIGEAAPGRIEVPGYALYYVCGEAGGPCLYRRQDFRVPLGVEAP